MDIDALGRERRYYVRVDTALDVQFKVEEGSSRKTYAGTTRNLSHGGLCLQIDNDLEELIKVFATQPCVLQLSIDFREVGEKVEVGARSRWTNARVDWMTKPSPKQPSILLGLAFENPTEETRDKIHSYIVAQFVMGYKLPPETDR